MFKRVLEVQTWRFYGCELVNLVNLMNLESLESSLWRESASPFIDEGDGLTSERERVCMLLSFAAHIGGYRTMVGTHNTVGCQMHVGGCVVFFGYGRRRHLPHCWYLETCRRGLPCLPGTVKVGAHNTVDAKRHVGGSLPYGS